MKKIVFTLFAFSSLMILSCRKEEEILDSEDLKSLSVLQEVKNKVNSSQIQSLNNLVSEKDSIIAVKKNINARMQSFQEMEMDSDIDTTKPPR